MPIGTPSSLSEEDLAKILAAQKAGVTTSPVQQAGVPGSTGAPAAPTGLKEAASSGSSFLGGTSGAGTIASTSTAITQAISSVLANYAQVQQAKKIEEFQRKQNAIATESRVHGARYGGRRQQSRDQAEDENSVYQNILRNV